MGKRNNFSKNDFRNFRKVEKCINQAGLDSRNGRGDHVVVYSPDGQDSFSYTRREMGTGLAGFIFKKLVSWGVIIGLILLSCYIAGLIQNLP